MIFFDINIPPTITKPKEELTLFKDSRSIFKLLLVPWIKVLLSSLKKNIELSFFVIVFIFEFSSNDNMLTPLFELIYISLSDILISSRFSVTSSVVLDKLSLLILLKFLS